MGREKIQISQKCGKLVLKTRQDKQRQCGVRSGVIKTQIFVCYLQYKKFFISFWTAWNN